MKVVTLVELFNAVMADSNRLRFDLSKIVTQTNSPVLFTVKMIEVKTESGIAVLKMDHGKVNAMDLEFCRALAGSLTELESSDCRAVVLTGNDRVFSAGVDLVRLIKEDSGYLNQFLPALTICFKTVFRFSKPIVAAINGHAIAGGCILATACDQRLIHDRARIGLPELRVGVPLPSVAIETMRFAVSREAFQSMVTIGKNYRGAEAVKVGLADQVVEKDALIGLAIDAANELASIPPAVFAISKKQMRLPAERRIAESEVEYEQDIEALWRTDEIQAEIREYVKSRL